MYHGRICLNMSMRSRSDFHLGSHGLQVYGFGQLLGCNNKNINRQSIINISTFLSFPTYIYIHRSFTKLNNRTYKYIIYIYQCKHTQVYVQFTEISQQFKIRNWSIIHINIPRVQEELTCRYQAYLGTVLLLVLQFDI